MSNRDLMARDLYGALGVSPAATVGEIRHAWRALALRHHPDLHPENRATCEARLKEINGAASLLLDDALRAEYDLQRLRPWPTVPASPEHRPAWATAQTESTADASASDPAWTPPATWEYSRPRHVFTVLRTLFWMAPVILPIVAAFTSNHHPSPTPYAYTPIRYEQPWRDADLAPKLYTPELEAIRWPDMTAAPDPTPRDRVKRHRGTASTAETETYRALRELVDEREMPPPWKWPDPTLLFESPWRSNDNTFSFLNLVAPPPPPADAMSTVPARAPQAEGCGLGTARGPCP